MASASEASQQANRSGMDPKRLVVIFYLVFGVVLALFLGHVLDLVRVRVGLPNPELFEGVGWSVTSLVGLVLAGGLGFWAWTNERIHNISLEVASELMKVTWPSWSETRVSTAAVVVASFVAAVVLFGIDTLAYNLMVEWIPLLWGKL
jgi:preprotein translocase subunit SecE